MMKIGMTAATSCANAFRQHAQHSVEVLALQLAIGVCNPERIKEFLFAPLLGCCRGDDLLSQNIQRSRRHVHVIKLSHTDRANQGSALDKFISRGCKQPSFRLGSDPVAGPSDTLKGAG